MFLGPETDVEKPPLAPKPQFIPLQKPVPEALNLDSSQPPINTVKYEHVSQPRLSKRLTPEWKPVSIFTSEYQSHFPQQFDSTQDLLQSHVKHKSYNDSGQSSVSTPRNVHEFSGAQLKPMRVTYGQSQGTVKNNLNFSNGLVGSEKNTTGKPHTAQSSSTSGLHPKSAESKSFLFNPTQRRHSADEQNDHLFPVPVQKASPIPVQNKPKSSHVGQPEKPDITSQEPRRYVKPKYKALTVKESTLAQVYKEGKTVAPRKQTNEKKSRSRPEIQRDSVELPGYYPRWNVVTSEQRQGQDLPNNTTSDTTPGKKSVTLKPKVKSLNQADLSQPDAQRKSSFKKLKDFEFSVKKLFSKAGPGPEVSTGKDEQSVDEGWHTTRTQNRSQLQIPQYRTHHVIFQHHEYSVERSVDGVDVENEHLYHDMSENINLCSPKCPGTQTPQTPMIWQGNLSDKEKRINGKTQVLGEFNTGVGQVSNQR